MELDTLHLAGLQPYPNSIVQTPGLAYGLVNDPVMGKKLLVVEDPAGFEVERRIQDKAWLCAQNPKNAAALRERLPWLRPAPLGVRTSMGFGDRLGLATPGHIRALAGTGVLPIFAQQSVRENTRTGRTPQQVLDEAMWGVFQEGYGGPWGADGDHVKTADEIDLFVSAGYSSYTVNSGLHVDDAAQTDPVSRLREKVTQLPWETLDSAPEKLEKEFLRKPVELDGIRSDGIRSDGIRSDRIRSDKIRLEFDEEALLRAAAKYGKVVAHITEMQRHLAAKMGPAPFDFEISIDETQTPTSAYEHYYIAYELRRLGVQWSSLAPRFIGEFEKGVDYQGDLQAFAEEFRRHCLLMNYFGGYKLSLHSGSDKFTIYPAIATHSQGLIHIKTAGTSYLEALRVLASCSPDLFRQILTLARGRYAEDRFSYMVSAEAERVPEAEALGDADLPGVLDQFDARQVLHVTFGSVLAGFGEPLKNSLRAHEEDYYELLEGHFRKHLKPFAKN